MRSRRCNAILTTPPPLSSPDLTDGSSIPIADCAGNTGDLPCSHMNAELRSSDSVDYADPDPWARFLAGLRALANNAYGFPNGSFLPVGYPVAANPLV